jgi:hypothetical protein
MKAELPSDAYVAAILAAGVAATGKATSADAVVQIYKDVLAKLKEETSPTA